MASPVGFIPFFEDVPVSAIVDLLGERPEQTRRLRLALARKTRELRGHGSVEAGQRELQDEIQDAFAEWASIHRSFGKKHEWQNREDEMSSTALRFQDQWSPVFMLSQLGIGCVLNQPAWLPVHRRDRRHTYLIESNSGNGVPAWQWFCSRAMVLFFGSVRIADHPRCRLTQKPCCRWAAG